MTEPSVGVEQVKQGILELFFKENQECNAGLRLNELRTCLGVTGDKHFFKADTYILEALLDLKEEGMFRNNPIITLDSVSTFFLSDKGKTEAQNTYKALESKLRPIVRSLINADILQQLPEKDGVSQLKLTTIGRNILRDASDIMKVAELNPSLKSSVELYQSQENKARSSAASR